jgi:hypothetical protein
VSELEDYCGSVVISCCCEKLAAEAWNTLETQRKGNIHLWKPLPSNSSEYMTVDTSVFVIVKCKVQSHIVSKCAINPISNPNPIYSNIPYM